MLAWIKAALVAGLVAALVGGGYYVRGVFAERADLKAQVSTLNGQLADATLVGSTTSTVLSARVQSSAAIKTKAKDVQVEIEKRIPADGDVVLSGDWRVLHDAAAEGTVPPGPGGVDAKAIPSKQALAGVAGNYEICLDNADRLDKLQRWVEGVSVSNP